MYKLSLLYQIGLVNIEFCDQNLPKIAKMYKMSKKHQN